MAKRGRKSRIVLGLNSGTSADGVDAVACEISGHGQDMKVRVIGHVETKYPGDVRSRLMAVMAPAATTTQELCRLHTAVGSVFATAATKAMRKLGLRRVDLVGSHGQTICHLPPRENVEKSRRQKIKKSHGKVAERAAGNEVGTLQIGDSALIASVVNAPVVSDFRHADMAVGGQGAPLVPWTDYVLFRDGKKSRVIQNIGGIANLTWLPAGGTEADVIAFDCGPGNMVIDALVKHFTRGRLTFDKGGLFAKRGQPDDRIFADMVARVDPFMMTPPPRSLGREEFGEQFVCKLLKKHGRRGLAAEDWIATATHLTAQTLFLSYWLYLRNSRDLLSIDEIILCGGGARNTKMIELLRRYLCAADGGERIAIRQMNEFGISTQAKECVSFAMLAAACVDRVPANLMQVTGARRRVVLGQIVASGG